MPDHRASRFALEVLFLVALAVGLALADVSPLLIAAVMFVGWLICAVLEWSAWRDEPHYGSGLPPRYYVPQVALPPRQPLEQVASGYPAAEQRDEAPTWIASPALRAEVLNAWPVSTPVEVEDTQPDGSLADEGGPPPARDAGADPEPAASPSPAPEPARDVAPSHADEGAAGEEDEELPVDEVDRPDHVEPPVEDVEPDTPAEEVEQPDEVEGPADEGPPPVVAAAPRRRRLWGRHRPPDAAAEEEADPWVVAELPVAPDEPAGADDREPVAANADAPAAVELFPATAAVARHRLDPLTEPVAKRWPWQRVEEAEVPVTEVPARPTGVRVLPGRSGRQD